MQHVLQELRAGGYTGRGWSAASWMPPVTAPSCWFVVSWKALIPAILLPGTAACVPWSSHLAPRES